MQLSYKINCSLKEYNEKVKNKTWEFPSYKECCPICKEPDCSGGNGFYGRIVIEIGMVIINLLIKRFICMKTKTTFSLLPSQLVPYSKYRLNMMAQVLNIWNKFKGNISATLDNIATENICNEINEIGISHMTYFRRIFETAAKKYRIWKKLSCEYTLGTFVGYCGNKYYCTSEILNNKYYCGNGGYEANSQFLFGRASQFRHTKK